MLIVWSFLMMFLLLPLADVAIAGFRYISAWQSLRAFGQYLQDHMPDDVTNASSWMTKVVAKADFFLSTTELFSSVGAKAMQFLPAYKATMFRPNTIHSRRPLPCRRWTPDGVTKLCNAGSCSVHAQLFRTIPIVPTGCLGCITYSVAVEVQPHSRLSSP